MLLEIVTRHLVTRPTLLERNQASVARLAGDWVQTLLIDEVGRGVDWANARMGDFTPTGDYVWVMDDDDECVLPNLVQGLAAIVADDAPDGVMVRMDHGAGLGILPSNQGWGGVLWQGGVGCSALISSRALWMACRSAWGAHYAGDFDYVQAAQGSGANIYWWNVVASRVSRRMVGAGEG